MHALGGIHCVLYALFNSDGTLDREAMRAQVEHMLSIGVDGISVLGLATEVQKLSYREQLDLINWTADDVAGKVPLSVTVSGNSVEVQRDVVNHALNHDADCLILQPPSVGAYSGPTYIDFFADVAEGFASIFAIQNAPQYLGRSLSNDQIALLRERNPGFSVIKSETSAIDLAALVQSVDSELTILNGRGGLEQTDCLRAGAHGFILAPDVIDYSKSVFDSWTSEDFVLAEKTYRDVLPAISFVMQTIEHLICYGKRLYGERMGLTIHDRSPALQATPFGLECVGRLASQLGNFREHE